MLMESVAIEGSAVPAHMPGHHEAPLAASVSDPGSSVSPLASARAQQAGGEAESSSAAIAHCSAPSESGTRSKAARTRERKGLPFVIRLIMAITGGSSMKALRFAREPLLSIRLVKGGATGRDALINKDHRESIPPSPMSVKLRQRAVLSVLSVLLIVFTVALPDIGTGGPKTIAADTGIGAAAVVVEADGAGEPHMPNCPLEAGCAPCVGCGVPAAADDPFLRWTSMQRPRRAEVAPLNALVPGIYRPPPEHLFSA